MRNPNDRTMKFGETYLEYKERVPRWVGIPRELSKIIEDSKGKLHSV